MTVVLPEPTPVDPFFADEPQVDADLFYFSADDLLRDDFDGKLKPILEIVFVRLFDEDQDFHLLITFLNDFLELRGQARIARVTRMQTRLLSDHAGEKDPVIDLR